MMKHLIYVTEDDENIRNLVQVALNGSGYETAAFETAEEALGAFKVKAPQLAIFDLMLAANPDTAKVGLLYDKSQASSLGAIEDAKVYCDEKGIAYVEKTGTTSAEVQAAADALVAEGVDAVFTPQDNTVMTAELSIFEKFIDAGIPHYTGADSFALNGAFCGYGVNYEELGTKTADMAVDILVNGADPAATPIETLERGIVTVNTETAEALGLDYSMFKDMCSEVVETVTAEEFE